MNAFVVILMSLLLVSLLVVSVAASGGQHCASEYRLVKYNHRAVSIPGCARRYMLIAIADRFSYKSADRMSLINYSY